jgi:hypothetical protein
MLTWVRLRRLFKQRLTKLFLTAVLLVLMVSRVLKIIGLIVALQILFAALSKLVQLVRLEFLGYGSIILLLLRRDVNIDVLVVAILLALFRASGVVLLVV